MRHVNVSPGPSRNHGKHQANTYPIATPDAQQRCTGQRICWKVSQRTAYPSIDRRSCCFQRQLCKDAPECKGLGGEFQGSPQDAQGRFTSSPEDGQIILNLVQTVEGARLQLVSDVGKTSAVIVSTLMEAWEVVRGGLVADGTVKDVSTVFVFFVFLS